MTYLAVLALACAFVQDPPPPPLPEVPKPPVIVDADGREAKPGVLPESTSPTARAAFERIVAATLPPAEAREPVRAFDLAIDLRYRASDAQSNDFPNARYRFLAPSFLRAGTGNGREHVRGPKGDWLVDLSKPEAPEKIRLDVGRENVEDRRQLDESAAVARLFAALTDPRALRVTRLVELASAPELPNGLAKAGETLGWVEIESPDVSLGASPAPNALDRIAVGYDKTSGRVQIARVERRGPPATALAIQLDKYKEIDRFQVPHAVQAWMLDPKTRAFRASPSMDLVIKKASLRAPLVPSDFEP